MCEAFSIVKESLDKDNSVVQSDACRCDKQLKGEIMTVVHYYYYRKSDGSLGKLLDDSPEAIEDIDDTLAFAKEEWTSTRVLAVVENKGE